MSAAEVCLALAIVGGVGARWFTLAARSVADFVPADRLSKALCTCVALKIEAAGVAGY